MSETAAYVRIGTSQIRLDGARARLERSFQDRLRLYARELSDPDLSDPDTFPTLIQAGPELRIRAGRLAELCVVTTTRIRAWTRGADLPDREGQALILSRILREVEARIRVLPDLSLPDQAASSET